MLAGLQRVIFIHGSTGLRVLTGIPDVSKLIRWARLARPSRAKVREHLHLFTTGNLEATRYRRCQDLSGHMFHVELENLGIFGRLASVATIIQVN